jgi:hypothetical protein
MKGQFIGQILAQLWATSKSTGLKYQCRHGMDVITITKTRLLFQHPLHYMSFTIINNELVERLNSTFTHDMSELTL